MVCLVMSMTGFSDVFSEKMYMTILSCTGFSVLVGNISMTILLYTGFNDVFVDVYNYIIIYGIQ